MDPRIWLTGERGEPRSVALAAERTVVGRSPDADRRWVVVYFENDRVQRIERDLELQPES